MPQYEFRNAVTGDTLMIESRMSSPPPEEIIPVRNEIGYRHVEPDELASKIYRRVYTCPAIAIEPDQAVKYNGLPVSKSLPRRHIKGAKEVNYHGAAVLEHKDGALTNRGGQPILDSKAAVQRECSRTGFVRERDTTDG